jgi:protein-S-isoprenylcysteine O-methyltransferase Ste14
VTVWQLYWFLAGATTQASTAGNLWIDALLAAQFVIPHSVLLLPAVRSRLTRVIHPAFYGCFYCVVTCLGLLAMFAAWQPTQHILWQTSGASRAIVVGLFWASWGALFYSLHLTGLGYQTGLTPWLYWLRRKPQPQRRFEPRGAYLWLRHPVYLSFLGLIWFAPVMTTDHAVLTGIWSGYIFLGSCLKDQRLLYYLGSTYRNYQAAVPGYPGMLLGPLARRPLPTANQWSAASDSEEPFEAPARRAA